MYFRSNANNEITTPKGRTLSLQLEGPGDTENNSPPTGDNEKLVVIQASERSLVEEDFQKAMRLTLVAWNLCKSTFPVYNRTNEFKYFLQSFETLGAYEKILCKYPRPIWQGEDKRLRLHVPL